MTAAVILLDSAVCHDCRATVRVVRRPVMIGGHRLAAWDCCSGSEPCSWSESTELREIVLLDSDGRPHRCAPAPAVA